MKPELWNRAKQILPEVRELPPEERAAYLDEACGGDQELRHEIDTFLATDPAALAFMERSPITLLGEGETVIREDSQFGAYQILRQLGSGGMGIVHLATRVGDDFHREVAIKVLPAGQTNEDAEQRFLQEMGILANLNHPNIAKLHEGGRTEDGRLYYLMEYVEGKPIDVYCREQKLSLEERLRLFQKVAAAVQYAHTQLVIHRDIKPSNVLVTTEGEPKLLDFGVAKPLEGAGIGAIVLTGGDQKLFTPDYASPEQIAGKNIHIASDVYSLGILLYELLAGDRPYRLKGLAEQESRQKVCDETPPPPSAATIRASSSDADEGTSSTDSTTATFRRKLEGDLDTIVLMALRKAPGDRYSTVQQLSDDIERHLLGHPIKARTPSLQYRARKFVNRNRVGLGVSALFLLFLTVAAAMLWRQYQETEHQRDRATAVAGFLEELFEAPDPYQGNQGDLSINEVLGIGARRLQENDTLDPATKAALLLTLGDVYINLGHPDSAEPLFQQSLTLIDETPAGIDRDLRAQALLNLADLHISRRNDKEAETAVLEALDLQRTPELVSQLGRVRRYQGRFEEAERAFLEARDGFKEKYGPTSDQYASELANLGTLNISIGEPEKAEEYFGEARGVFLQLYGGEHITVARLTHNLAAAIERQGRYREAKVLYIEAVAQKSAAIGEGHPTVASSLNSLATVHMALGEYDEARLRYEKAIEVLSKRFGDEHPLVAMYLNNLADLNRIQGRFEEAETMYRRSLSLRKVRLGEDHIEVATTLNNLAVMYFDLGDNDRFRAHLEQADSLLAGKLPAGHPTLGSMLYSKGRLLLEDGQPQAALALFEELLDAEQGKGRPQSFLAIRAYRGIATAQIKLGHLELAQDAIERGFAALESMSLGGHWWHADLESLKGEVLWQSDREQEALPVLRSAYQGISRVRGERARTTKIAKARFLKATGPERVQAHPD